MPLHDSEQEIIDRDKLDAFRKKRDEEMGVGRPSRFALAGGVIGFAVFAVMILAPLAELVWLDRHFPQLGAILDSARTIREWCGQWITS